MADSHSLSSSAEILREQAAWHRSMADRIDSLANEIQPPPEPDLHRKEWESAKEAAETFPIVPQITLDRVATNGHPILVPSVLDIKPIQDPPLEFAGLTQKDAILKALRTYGPQNASELWTRIREGGMPGLTRQQLGSSANAAKFNRSVMRDDDGKYRVLEVISK